MPRHADGDIDIAKRNARIVEMRSAGHSYQYIGDEIGLSGTQIRNILLDEIRKLPTPNVEEVRKEQLATYDSLASRAYKILEKSHLTVQHGKVVQYKDPVTGELAPLEDEAPVMQAIALILKVEAQKADLLGTKAPTKVEATVAEVTQADLELQEFLREAKARQAAEESRVARPSMLSPSEAQEQHTQV